MNLSHRIRFLIDTLLHTRTGRRLKPTVTTLKVIDTKQGLRDTGCVSLSTLPITMARLWLTFGVLIALSTIFIAQRTSLAGNYRPWFLATHPDSAQASDQGAIYLAQKLGEGDQQSFPVSTPLVITHHASDIQGNLPEDAFVRRIVAVGDLHGDFGNARKVLEMSGVIGKEGEWTGQVDFFVQTGDIIDR